MADLGGLTRREFFRGALLVAAGLAVSPSDYSEAVAQQNPINVFSRGLPYDIESQKPIELEQYKKPYVLSAGDQKIALNELSKIPNLFNIEKRLLESYAIIYIKIEPDYAYAQGLAKEAEISIAHLFNFLNSAHLQKPAIDITTPRKKEDIRFKDYKNIPLYLVGDLGVIIVTNFEYYVGGIKKTSQLKKLTQEQGVTIGHLKINEIDNELKLEKDINFPVFYNTSSHLVHLVEVPAIEALHHVVQKYTFENFKKKLKTKQDISSRQAIFDLHYEYGLQEEKFVHALSILWLGQYINDRNFDLRQDELAKRFARYEDIPIYKGANALARHISRIGIPMAIELYINKPDELFKVLRN